MPSITVEKALHMRNAHVSCVAYTSLTAPVLTERVWAEMKNGGNWETGKLLARTSTDNGRTWETTGTGLYETPAGDRILRRCQPVYHLDPVTGILVEFVTHYEWWTEGDDGDFGPGAVSDYLPFRTGRIFYRISRDEGRTWGPETQIIQQGEPYDSVHWADGMFYEKNSASFSELHEVVRLPDGSLLLPIGVSVLDDDGQLIKLPDRFGDTIWPIEGCACLIGRWREDGSDLDWEISNRITTPEYMSRGLCEPAVVEAANGKLMMVMRGCSTARQALPGVKFLSISKDAGRTWGPAVPLTYPDAGFVHSPGSLPNLFRSSKNGKLYLIANILPAPCRHCDPRYPLAIAEVDPEFFWVLPETVTTIAGREARHPNRVRFSNWQRIEDRETHNPVLFLTESRTDAIIPGTEGQIIQDAYRYEIHLPE